MVINKLLRHRISVSRLTATEGIVKEQQVILSGIAALVIPADAEATTQYGVSISQGFDIYTNSNVVLKPTDKITDNRGRIFIVRGVSEYDDFDVMNYHSYFCEKVANLSDEDDEEDET